MPNARLRLIWNKHPRFHHTIVAALPDGSEVAISALGAVGSARMLFVEHIRGKHPQQLVRTISRIAVPHDVGTPLDKAKQAAEEWAAEAYPLAALGQVAKKNPTKLEEKLAKIEALRRGATTPGERRAAQAAYDRIVSQLLAEAEAEPEPAPRAPPPGVDKKELRATQKLLEEALRAVFGPSWGRLDSDARAGLIDEAYVRWLEAGGDRRVDVRQIANDVRRASRSARDREVGFGSYASDEAGSFVDPEDAWEAAERAEQAASLWQLLEEFAGRDEVSKMQATIVQLHLGEKVFPGQPNRLRGDLPQRDLAAFHPGGGPRCPTCRAVARYVRVAGLTPDAVGSIVDGVLADIRQQI